MKLFFLIFYKKIKNLVLSFLNFIKKNLIFLILIFIIICYFFKKQILINYFIKNYNKYIKNTLIKNTNICNKIDINGLNLSDISILQKHIDVFCKNNNYSLSQLEKNILLDPWIKLVNIKKKIPDNLIIDIIEYSPFAVWYDFNEKKYHLIDQFGDKINVSEDVLNQFKHLLIIAGDGFKDDINNFFNLLSVHSEIATNIIKIERIGERRWNLILKDNILVKMPEENENIFETWDLLESVIKIHGLSVNLIEIDLRIKDKIFLKYKNQTVQEIKNI